MAASIRGSLPCRTYQCLTRPALRTPRLANTWQLSTSTSLRSTSNHATNSKPLHTQRSGSARDDPQAAKYRRSIILSAAGMLACAATMYGVIKLDVFGMEAIEGKKEQEKEEDNKTAKQNYVTATRTGAMKLDGPPGFPPSAGPSVIPIQGQDGVEQVATGNSTVPYFPSTIRLPSGSETEGKKSGDELSTAGGDEYQLLGLGIRTVSFLSIQVYVVGLYVAKADISELQQRLVRTAIHPPDVSGVSTGAAAAAATSLVPPERQQLKEILLDAERGDAAWTALLKDDGIRTAFRIVPTRNTDFMHLRDGWVRGITGRAQKKKGAEGEFQDDAFGAAMNDFKAVFGGNQRKSVPKGQTLVLVRNAHGVLDVLLQSDPEKPIRWMGHVEDERISRLVWLNYLAGKSVSSEGARKSVVDGLMIITERPVGTVVP